MTSARLRLEWAILLALAIAGAAFLNATASTDRIDNQILDTASALTRPPPSDDIVLVTIDDRSLGQKGNWPWSRAIHARLVEKLTEAEPKLILFDVLFIEPSDAQADEALAAAIARDGNVLLPHSFRPRPNTAYDEEPLFPLPQLADAAKGIGHVAVATDPDGVLRRFDLTYRINGERYPHLTIAAMDAMGEPVDPALRTASPVVPFQDRSSFREVSAASVIDGSLIGGVLTDKIVLVGATAQGMGDRFSVASGDVGLMTGVEAQANLLNALLLEALIQPLPRIWHDVIAAGALLLLFMAFWYLSPRFVLACALALIVAMLAISIALLSGARLWLPPASTVIVIMLAYPLWSWRRLSHASRYLDREAARLTGSAVVSGDYSGLDYVTHQIEQLRALIRTVHDSLSFLRRVIEAAPDAIVVLDKDKTVRMLNAKAAQLFPGSQTVENPAFGEFLLYSKAKLVRDGDELETSDGRAFLIARAELQSADETGESGSIIVLRDVTEIRKLDDERRQMLEFLSHDMRTPQVAIVGLTRRAFAPGEPADPDMIRRIRIQANRTLKLADDFVQLARLESPDLQLDEADVGAIVEEAVDRAYALAENKRITLTQDIPADPCFARVDASLIARMLDNLIGNAIKYSSQGGEVFTGLQASGEERFTLTVSDNGPGLSPERQAEPFKRFGTYSTDSGPSAGLGLALVKKVVDAHHGTIHVTSTPGEGTAFRIEVPISLD